MLQKLLDVDVGAGRNSALGKITAATTPAADPRQYLLEQGSHVSGRTRCILRASWRRCLSGCLSEDEAGRIDRAGHQRDGGRGGSGDFLRKEFGESYVAIGKCPHNYLLSLGRLI